MDKDKVASDIEAFARENDLQLHPGQSSPSWARLVEEHNGCPCVPDRKECPCAFVLEDIEELGRCRCGLFCNGRYLREYTRLIGQRKGNRRGRKGEGRVPQEDQHQRVLDRRAG